MSAVPETSLILPTKSVARMHSNRCAHTLTKAHNYTLLCECKQRQIHSLALSHRHGLRHTTFNNTRVVTSQNGHNKELLCYITALKCQFCTVCITQKVQKGTDKQQPRQTNTNAPEPGEDQTQMYSHSARHIDIQQINPDTKTGKQLRTEEIKIQHNTSLGLQVFGHKAQCWANLNFDLMMTLEKKSGGHPEDQN